MNSYDSSKIEVIEGHSITEEAFENFGNESVQENVSPRFSFSVLNFGSCPILQVTYLKL